LVEEVASIGRERQKNFLQFTLQNIRNNFAMTSGALSTVKLSEVELEFAKKFHEFIHANNTTRIFDDLNKAYSDIERNVNSKMVFLDISLRLCGHLKIPKQ
jgi:DNA polymerase-3 subunit delta'